MAKYCIGIDYKAFTGLALLVNTENGEVVASASKIYSHGIMAEGFINPMDYLEVLSETIPDLLKQSGADSTDIIGIGINFNESAILPVMNDGTPLCFFKEYADEPFAHVMLSGSKNIADNADRLNRIAASRCEAFLSRYGGKTAAGGMLPKIMEMIKQAPGVYDTCDYIIEAADWVVWQLTGVQTRNASNAGFDALWSRKEGYPSAGFLSSLDARLEKLDKKLDSPILAPACPAGKISAFAAKALGLSTETIVCVAASAVQSSVAACGIDGPAKMLTMTGENGVNIVLSENELFVPKITASANDGIYAGLCGYISPGTDDEKILSAMENLTENDRADSLLAVNIDGKYVFLGATPRTGSAALTYAAAEALAYQMRMSVENFRSHGVAVNELYVLGDSKEKDVLMQIYADVLDLPVILVNSDEPSAKGSAIFAAVASGAYKDIPSAVKAMGCHDKKRYLPDTYNTETYSKLYDEYIRLYDYFKGGANDVMKRLDNIENRPEYDEELPTLDSEFGISADEEIPEANESVPEKEEYSDEVKAAAAAAAKELFEAIDAVAAIRDDAEIFAAFNDLVKEEAEKNTKEILDSTDEVVRLMEEAEHDAYFGQAIEEEAEKNTREIIAAIDEVVKLMEEADREAAEKDADNAQ